MFTRSAMVGMGMPLRTSSLASVNVCSRASLSSMAGTTQRAEGTDSDHFNNVAKAAQAEAAATYGLQLTPDEAAQLAKVALAFARAKLHPQYVPTRINYSAAAKNQIKRDTKQNRDRQEEQRIRALALKRLGRITPYYPLESTTERFMAKPKHEDEEIAASVLDDRQTSTSLISDIKRRIADQAAMSQPETAKLGPDGKPFRARTKNVLPNRLITTGLEFHPMNIWVLSRFLHRGGGMLPRKQTGLTHKQQRHLSRAVKRARNMAFLPYQTQFHMGPLGNTEDEVFPDGGTQHPLLPPIRIVEHTEIVPPRQVLRYRSANRIGGNAIASGNSIRSGRTGSPHGGSLAAGGAAAVAASNAPVSGSGPVVYKRRSVPFGGSNKVTLDFSKPKSTPEIVVLQSGDVKAKAAAADVAAGAARAVAAAAAARDAANAPETPKPSDDESK